MKCGMRECENTLSEHTRMRLCVNCRASIGRWEHRRTAEILERRRKLHLYDNRVKVVVERRKK